MPRSTNLILALVTLVARSPHTRQSNVSRPEEPPVASPLRVTNERPVPGLQAAPLWLPLQCDSRGNVYARISDGPRPFPPVVKISADASEITTFSPEAEPTIRRENATEYAVGPGGEFYFMAGRREEGKQKILFLRYRSDGSLDSTITLDTLLVPLKFAVFSTGDFFITGMTWVNSAKETREPFTAVANRFGNVTRVSLPDDTQPEKPTLISAPEPDSQNPVKSKNERPKSQATQYGDSTHLMDEIGRGEAVAGDDGNVYVYRHTPDNRIYVVQPNGNVLRTLSLRVPWPGYSLQSINVVGGRVAANLYSAEPKDDEPFSVRIALYDALTSEFLYGYSVPRTAGVPACYAPSGMTFLLPDTSSGRVLLRSAAF